MKKLILTMVVVIFAIGLFAGSDFVANKSHSSEFQANTTREDIIVYQEDFENGLNGWTHYDGTLPSSMWHLDDEFNVYGGSGYSWWMGDPAIGGYIDHLYVVMDTPQITVPTGGHLTFMLNWYAETPGGEPAGYDGWDGCNIRISTDAGESWTPVEGTPAYTCESLYSFGFEHGEGQGIPGWGGPGNGWENADFDLSAYAGQDVMIRFAFASDPAYSTQDEPEMFGMMIDNISLGSFNENFNDGDEHGMTYTSMVDVGGDIWHIGEVGDAPSGTHAAVCQNDAGSYNTGMLDYFESPTIPFPMDGEIKADFMIKGAFFDDDTFPEVDFFGWEVSPDNGDTWYYMSNPDGDPSGSNYVYSDAPDIWSSMVQSYSLSGVLSGFDGMYEGQDVKFRIYFETDDDAPDGTGIMIDDFTVIQTIYPGPGPIDISAVSDNNAGTIGLSWTPPEEGGQEGWIGWDNGEYAGSLGLQDPGEWAVADRFTVGDVIPYVGGSITTVKIFPAEASADYTVKIWRGSNAATLVAEVPVSNPTIEDWNEITIPTPVEVLSGQELWIGYGINQTAGSTYPAGYDSGPNQNGLYANLGSWQDISGDYPNNWLIQAYVEAEDGRTYPVFHNTRDRDITGYNIWHSNASGELSSYELIDTIDPAESYVHTTPDAGMFNYYRVTALWDGENSVSEEEAFDYLVADDEEEFSLDDGTSESGFNVGITKHMAVKFAPAYSRTDWTLTNARVYVHDEVLSGQIILKAWDDDGADGMPGTMLFQFVYPPGDIHQGWNTIEIPEANQPTFTEGEFYLGIFEMAGLSPIGLDEDGFGNSYTDVSGSWELEETGNVMIRAIARGFESSVQEEFIPKNSISLSNYPNPFNPSTTISLNIPSQTEVAIDIYNMKGQKVKTLVDGVVDSGLSSYRWNGLDDNGNQVTSGIYFYKLNTAGNSITKKMILMK